MATGEIYWIELYPNNMTFSIISKKDTENPINVVKGKDKNISALKLTAKKAAKELGVVFFDEVRTSKKEIKPEVPNV